MTSKSEGLLAGLRVIEMSHVMAAPTCGMMLADMGADVIKVEPPGRGDFTVPPETKAVVCPRHS